MPRDKDCDLVPFSDFSRPYSKDIGSYSEELPVTSCESKRADEPSSARLSSTLLKRAVAHYRARRRCGSTVGVSSPI